MPSALHIITYIGVLAAASIYCVIAQRKVTRKDNKDLSDSEESDKELE